MKSLKIEELLKPLIEDLGYELWACEYLAQGKHSVLRVYIDHLEGISIDDCSKVSHHVSAVLDVEDPISGNYQLEISSPGLDRPLFKPAHYECYIGHDVQLKLNSPVAKRRKLKGSIKAITDSILTLELDEGLQDIDVSNIVKANLVV